MRKEMIQTNRIDKLWFNPRSSPKFKKVKDISRNCEILSFNKKFAGRKIESESNKLGLNN